jgi:hypothetical protein
MVVFRNIVTPGFLETEGARQIGQAWIDLRQRACGLQTSPLPQSGYAIAREGSRYRDGVVIVTGPDGTVVGGIASGVVVVAPEHRGIGLGAEAVILAFATGIKRVADPVVFSEAGYGNRRAAHRIAVKRAIRGGLRVPDEVLADYPHLLVSA